METWSWMVAAVLQQVLHAGVRGHSNIFQQVLHAGEHHLW